jgi:hypothetical protein
LIARFVAACETDDRVLAALLVGSHAAGNADTHSDVDLLAVVADDAYDDFVASLGAFVRLLGDPVLEETFDLPGIVFAIYADGADLELNIGRAGELALTGPCRVLLDRVGVVDRASRSASRPKAETTELVRRQVAWFWHDWSHFTTALARGNLVWAFGQLDDLRRTCLNLARLLADPEADAEGYWKAEASVPDEVLADLRATMVLPQAAELEDASKRLLDLYRRLAREAATRYGLRYPDELDRLLSQRADKPG